MTIRTDARRRNRAILIALAVLVLLWLVVRAWDALVPFLFALALGYLLVPLIDRLARAVPRAVAILLVYLVFFGSLLGVGVLVAPPAAEQVRELIRTWPRYSAAFTEYTQDVQQWYQSLDLPADVRTSIENSLRTAAGSVLNAAQVALVGTLRVLSGVFGFIFGLFVIPFWLFYVMKDKDSAVRGFYDLIPAPIRGDVRRILRIASDVLNDYIRGQLLLGVVVGLATTVGLFLVGAPYWLLLGLVNGFTELIPVIGPIIGAVPGLIVAALQGDWGLFAKVGVVYIVVQLAENNLLVPKIQGDSVKLHPAVIILVLVVGGEVAGLPGIIVSVPLAAIARDVFLYLYRRFGEGYRPRDAEAMVPSRIDEDRAAGINPDAIKHRESGVAE